ncbi:hypothetical protein HHI36_008805 [Cryptolaemus montrouzieri]|uniref:Uncharacterized protein n=1 Tax=Cryptolaemus montrouzieri TaxID=559131 RepID=A0ABD2MTG9_9CUCU
MAALPQQVNVLDANFEEVCMKWFYVVNSDISDEGCEEDKFLESIHETNSEQKVSVNDAGRSFLWNLLKKNLLKGVSRVVTITDTIGSNGIRKEHPEMFVHLLTISSYVTVYRS